MRTGHQICDCLRKDFADLLQHSFVQGYQLGALDAPEFIDAGSHHQVLSIGGDFSYPLPTVIDRDIATWP